MTTIAVVTTAPDGRVFTIVPCVDIEEAICYIADCLADAEEDSAAFADGLTEQWNECVAKYHNGRDDDDVLFTFVATRRDHWYRYGVCKLP